MRELSVGDFDIKFTGETRVEVYSKQEIILVFDKEDGIASKFVFDALVNLRKVEHESHELANKLMLFEGRQTLARMKAERAEKER